MVKARRQILISGVTNGCTKQPANLKKVVSRAKTSYKKHPKRWKTEGQRCKKPCYNCRT
jgi:hypothetical protein